MVMAGEAVELAWVLLADRRLLHSPGSNVRLRSHNLLHIDLTFAFVGIFLDLAMLPLDCLENFQHLHAKRPMLQLKQ